MGYKSYCSENQNILVDQVFIEKICSAAELSEDDDVVEIGAGPGNLTRCIAEKCRRVTAVEIDQRFKPSLDAVAKAFKNVRVHIGDILKFDMSCDKILGNIPYAATEPIIKKLFVGRFKCAVLTIPKSFAERVIRKSSVMGLECDVFFELEVLYDVPGDAFQPATKTRSVVVRLRCKELGVMGSIIMQNGKKTKNALLEALCMAGMTKNQARQLLPSDIPKKRVSELNLDELRSIQRWAGTLCTS
jgi:16S rRNA (adenine1518-N6/adenine1519-N6)-dimethyltransferase